MAFLDKTGLQTLTNKLVQGDAIKVASHRGRTVENVIDNITRECGNVPTPLEYKIENRVADFRVGQGRDVDASGDVEKGYSEIELQGKTWQNLININKSSIADKNTVEIRDNSVIFLEGANIVSFVDFNIKELLKPNVQYTVMLDVSGCNGADNQVFQCGITDGNSWYPFLPRITSNGRYSVSFKPVLPETSLRALFRVRHNSSSEVSTEERVLSNIIILEGDHTQTPVEELPQYFEGIKSSFEDGVVEFESVGKNLFDSSNGYDQIPHYNNKYNLLDNGFEFNGNYYLTFDVSLKKGKTYFAKWDSEHLGGVVSNSIVKPRKGSEPLDISFTSGKSFVALDDYDKILFYTNMSSEDSHYRHTNIIISEVPITQYEPYKKETYSFDIGEPLRSLPNGVYDEVRNNNGQWELVRRVGKAVLDGSESWAIVNSATMTNTIMLVTTIKDILAPSSKRLSLCDRFASDNSVPYSRDYECVFCNQNNSKNIGFRINKSKLSTHDSQGLKQWLSQNPTTVYYELATPVITPIEPLKIKTLPLGNINIKSDIAPISFHKVQLNRASQIERGIVEISELKKRVEKLETIYDSNFLETAHKLELLGMDYELESEEV